MIGSLCNFCTWNLPPSSLAKSSLQHQMSSKIHLQRFWWTSRLVEPLAPCLILTHINPCCRISCLDLLVLTQYNPYGVTVGVSSPPPSSEAIKFIACSHLQTLLVMMKLLYCCLLSSYSSCRSVDIYLYPLSESSRIETGGDISRSIFRTPFVPRRKSVVAGENYRRFSKYLATL